MVWWFQEVKYGLVHDLTVDKVGQSLTALLVILACCKQAWCRQDAVVQYMKPARG